LDTALASRPLTSPNSTTFPSSNVIIATSPSDVVADKLLYAGTDQSEKKDDKTNNIVIVVTTCVGIICGFGLLALLLFFRNIWKRRVRRDETVGWERPKLPIGVALEESGKEDINMTTRPSQPNINQDSSQPGLTSNQPSNDLRPNHYSSKFPNQNFVNPYRTKALHSPTLETIDETRPPDIFAGFSMNWGLD
jgi:hypothetical protein